MNLLVNNGQNVEGQMEAAEDEQMEEQDETEEGFGLTPEQVEYLQQLQQEQNLSEEQLLQVQQQLMM